MHRSRPRSLVAAVALVAFAASDVAWAEWRRTDDLNYNTAFTLEQGRLEIGVITPLSIGVTDEVQVALHPILLLLGQPYVAVRWRMTREQDVTFGLNAAASWSFFRKEDANGVAASDAAAQGRTGFPGSVQLTGTVTFKAGRAVLLSVGAGPALDFLGEELIRGLAELHLSAHWLMGRRYLLMLHGQLYLGEEDGGVVTHRPYGSLMVAAALTNELYLGAGLGVGEFIFELSDGERETLDVFPVADLWFRF